MVRSTDPLGFTDEYTYDPETGNVSASEDHNDLTTSYTYDALQHYLQVRQ